MSRKFLLVAMTLICISACTDKDPTKKEEGIRDSNVNTIESAMGLVGSIAIGSEGGDFTTMSDEGDFAELQSPPAEMFLAGVCSLTTARTKSCSGPYTSTINWNSCQLGQTSLTGGWVETWSAADVCNQGHLTMNSVGTVTRTAPTGTNIIFDGGAKLTTSTEAHNTFSDATTLPVAVAIPNTGILTSMATDGSRTVTINGAHRVLTGPLGTLWFDHSLKTINPLLITGRKSTSDREVVSGSIRVYHNRLKAIAELTFSNVKWGTPTCCYPTSGNISGVFTGTRVGSGTLAFKTACGVADFTDLDGRTIPVALRQCE